LLNSNIKKFFFSFSKESELKWVDGQK
jgi:hypothetical protein